MPDSNASSSFLGIEVALPPIVTIAAPRNTSPPTQPPSEPAQGIARRREASGWPTWLIALLVTGAVLLICFGLVVLMLYLVAYNRAMHDFSTRWSLPILRTLSNSKKSSFPSRTGATNLPPRPGRDREYTRVRDRANEFAAPSPAEAKTAKGDVVSHHVAHPHKVLSSRV